MKIMAFGDIHFHNSHRFSNIEPSGYTTREIEQYNCAKTLIGLTKEENIDKVVFLGDAWQAVGDTISAETQSIMIEFFAELRRYLPNLSVILGNHDLINNNPEINKLNFIKYMPPIEFYWKPEVKDTFVYMPYCLNDDEAIRFLEAIPNKQDKIIFSHLELGGINLVGGIFTKKGVPLDLLNQFKMTLQGHYHSGGSYGHKIQITGSTQRLSFKDKGISRKNILIYDTETDKIIRKSFESPDWLIFDDNNIDDLLKIDNNNYVKVDLTTDILLTDEIKSKLEQVKGKTVHIDLTRISVNKQIDDDTITKEDNIGVIRKFVNKSDNDEDRKEQLIQEGTRLLNKVS